MKMGSMLKYSEAGAFALTLVIMTSHLPFFQALRAVRHYLNIILLHAAKKRCAKPDATLYKPSAFRFCRSSEDDYPFSFVKFIPGTI